jgi:hypothetical protein
MADTLPPLVVLADYGNDWDDYLEAIYSIYMTEVVNAGLTFRGLPLHVQFRPMSHGKGFGFWHLISEGEIEEERLPDLHRCERIQWIPWMIHNSESNTDILWWENKRDSHTHIVLWLPVENFAVILAKRKGYYLLKTAYILKPHRAKAFESEWKRYWEKGKGPLSGAPDAPSTHGR